MTSVKAVCRNPVCPISLFEHTVGHGECVPTDTAPAPTAHIVRADTVRIEVQIPEPDPEDGFELWVDRIAAVWRPPVGPPTATGGWWELSGQNCGAGNGMIIHRYQIGPLITLLQAMEAEVVFDVT